MANAARDREDALALSVEVRTRVVHELISSLEPEDADAAAAWSEEIRKRIDDVEAGTAELESWETVRLASKTPVEGDSSTVSPIGGRRRRGRQSLVVSVTISN